MSDDVYEFLEYLNIIQDDINVFKVLVLASEILSDLGLTSEQLEAGNAFLEQVRNEWNDGFKEMLKKSVLWIETNQEDKK